MKLLKVLKKVFCIFCKCSFQVTFQCTTPEYKNTYFPEFVHQMTTLPDTWSCYDWNWSKSVVWWWWLGGCVESNKQLMIIFSPILQTSI